MTGNVWQWCADWYGVDTYQNSLSRNPIGPATGTARVLRGGSWGNDNWGYLRAASRRFHIPARGAGNIGFRCAACPPGQ